MCIRDSEKRFDQAQLGSLVTTDQLNYFLSIGVGKLIIDDQIYYAISELSPIGQLLIAKKEKETIIFREKTITIQEIK